MSFKFKFNTKLLIGALCSICLSIVLSACKSDTQKETFHHFTKRQKFVLDSLIKQENSKNANHYLDSIYASFSYKSAADKFNYYGYKKSMIDKTKGNSTATVDTELAYVDSMIFMIEANHLEKEMSIELASAYKDKMAICTAWGLNEEAAGVVAKSILINLENKDTCATAENTKALAFIAFKQAKYDEAIELYKKALLLEKYCAKDSKQYYRTQHNLVDLGLSFGTNKQVDSSIKYYLQAEKYIEENKALSSDTLFPYEALLNVYANLGQIYRNTPQLDLAESYNLKAYNIADEIFKDTSTMAQIKLFLADTYFKQNKIAKAGVALSEGEKQSAKFYLEDFQLWARIGKDLALANKDFKKYSFFAEKYLLFSDSTRKIETNLQRKNPQAEYERLDKKRQVELLEKNNKIQQNKITAGIIIAILLTTLAITLFYNLRKIRRIMQQLKQTMLEKELQAKQKQKDDLIFQEFSFKIKNAELLLQQRLKISQDLHDDLSGALAGLRYYIDDLIGQSSEKNNKGDLINIGNEVKTIYQNTRNYMHQLNAGEKVSKHSLPNLLDEMCNRFAQETSLVFQVDFDKDNFLLLLSTYQQEQLYYIINEALANIFKHANATKISVALYLEKNSIHFSIADNGNGFNYTEQVQNGLGLKNMKLRLNELGGEFKIQSSNEGTVIQGAFQVN